MVLPGRIRRVLSAHYRGSSTTGGHRAPTYPGSTLDAVARRGFQPELASCSYDGGKLEQGRASKPSKRLLPAVQRAQDNPRTWGGIAAERIRRLFWNVVSDSPHSLQAHAFGRLLGPDLLFYSVKEHLLLKRA